MRLYVLLICLILILPGCQSLTLGSIKNTLDSKAEFGDQYKCLQYAQEAKELLAEKGIKSNIVCCWLTEAKRQYHAVVVTEDNQVIDNLQKFVVHKDQLLYIWNYEDIRFDN